MNSAPGKYVNVHTNVLRYAEGCESVEVDQDEEQAAERALVSMMRAAGWT